MAKVKIAEKAVVIVSEKLTLADIKKVSKYDPKALVLTDDEKKSEIFKIGVAETGNGTINQYGVSFAPKAYNENGYAAVTVIAPEDVTDVKAYVIDKYAGAIANLNKLEGTIPAALTKVTEMEKKVSESITTV